MPWARGHPAAGHKKEKSSTWPGWVRKAAVKRWPHTGMEGRGFPLSGTYLDKGTQDKEDEI